MSPGDFRLLVSAWLVLVTVVCGVWLWRRSRGAVRREVVEVVEVVRPGRSGRWGWALAGGLLCLLLVLSVVGVKTEVSRQEATMVVAQARSAMEAERRAVESVVVPQNTVQIAPAIRPAELGQERPATAATPGLTNTVPLALPAPVAPPEPAYLFRPSAIVQQAPVEPEEDPFDEPTVVTATSQWWATSDDACRQASAVLVERLLALRTADERALLAQLGQWERNGPSLDWTGVIEETVKDFGNDLRAKMYRVHLRVTSQERFVALLRERLAEARDRSVVRLAEGAFVGVVGLFVGMGWMLRRWERSSGASDRAVSDPL
jgi:hypothetical protein